MFLVINLCFFVVESSFCDGNSGEVIMNFRFNNYSSHSHNPNISLHLMNGITFVIPEMNYFLRMSGNGSFDEITMDALDIIPKPSCILKR